MECLEGKAFESQPFVCSPSGEIPPSPICHSRGSITSPHQSCFSHRRVFQHITRFLVTSKESEVWSLSLSSRCINPVSVKAHSHWRRIDGTNSLIRPRIEPMHCPLWGCLHLFFSLSRNPKKNFFGGGMNWHLYMGNKSRIVFEPREIAYKITCSSQWTPPPQWRPRFEQHSCQLEQYSCNTNLKLTDPLQKHTHF